MDRGPSASLVIRRTSENQKVMSLDRVAVVRKLGNATGFWLVEPWWLSPHSQGCVATECDVGPAAPRLGVSKAVVVEAGGHLVSIPGDVGGSNRVDPQTQCELQYPVRGACLKAICKCKRNTSSTTE